MSLYHEIFLGETRISGNLFAAPLAGYTDIPFRQMCMQGGADLAFTEMVSCEGLWRGSDRTYEMMHKAPLEKHLAVQLFAGNVEAVERAIPYALKVSPAVLDFNCGCPVPKVYKSHAGSALSRNPDLFFQLLKTLRTHTPKDIAVTVKIRSGWDLTDLNYLHMAERAFNAGVDMLTMHPRTRSQGYSGLANWTHLREMKKAFPEKVICGSGDLFSPEDAKRMLEQTGVDALMFARGMMGNPFIFKQTRDLLVKGSYEPITEKQKVAMAYAHLQQIFATDKSVKALREFKKHLLSYAKGIHDGKPLKEAFTRLENPDEAEQLLQSVIQQLPQS